MTIFDIRPYSYWRNLHRIAHRAWVKLGQDTPRSVCELTLLREVNRRLARELAAANDLAERRSKLLREAMEENRYLMVRLVAAEPSEAPPCNVSPLASINTPASGETHEIDGVACATEGARQHV